MFQNKCKMRGRLLTGYLVLLMTAMGCRKDLKFSDAVLITGAESTNVIGFTVDGASSSLALTATATGLSNEDIVVEFTIDTSLLSHYNTVNQTNFHNLPAGSYQLSTDTVRIRAGQTVSNALTVTITSTGDLVAGRNYMLPVSIKVLKGSFRVLSPSGIAYLKINQVITTSAIQMTNGPFIDTTFPNTYLTLNKFTLEMRLRANSFGYGFHINTVIIFNDPNSNNDFNILRFGELSDAVNQLQWINSGGKVSSNTLFATGTWYNVDAVFDGTNCSMYVNGVLDASFSSSTSSYHFKGFRISSSGQPFDGALGEVRLWSRALSAGEIQNGFCGVDPSSSGLEVYWKMNDGSGNTLTDYAGKHLNLVSPDGDFNWVTGLKCPN